MVKDETVEPKEENFRSLNYEMLWSVTPFPVCLSFPFSNSVPSSEHSSYLPSLVTIFKNGPVFLCQCTHIALVIYDCVPFLRCLSNPSEHSKY